MQRTALHTPASMLCQAVDVETAKCPPCTDRVPDCAQWQYHRGQQVTNGQCFQMPTAQTWLLFRATKRQNLTCFDSVSR